MRFAEQARTLGIAALSVINPLLPHFKNASTSRGLNYHYYFSAPAPGQPTLLLVHGFPSLAVDWHPQIAYFEEKGFGLVAPDQLGYGGTDKPAEPAAYVHSLLAKDLVDILDRENATDVVAIGHDWGTGTVSVLANLYPDRFLGFGFLGCGYFPPHSIAYSLEELREQAIALLGYENFGYWEFFMAADGAQVIQAHLENFFDLLHSKDGRVWEFNLCPQGAARIFLESNTRTPRIAVMSEDQWKFHQEHESEGGAIEALAPYLLAKADNDKIPLESYTLHKPVFFAGASNDFTCVNWAQEATVRQYALNLTVTNVNATHWIAADAAKEVNEALEKWIDEVVLGCN
ncbi:hypothetical protein NMY22_g12946 [Coprinellus aureogranulatus]|nr:hypothetical protein NMY22_g12946 [Coprinellus aureogranulatus]